MAKIAAHTGLHLMLILALILAPAAGLWASTENALPKTTQGHCEHMAAETAKQLTATVQHDCCQGHDECNGCCSFTAGKYDTVFARYSTFRHVDDYLTDLQVVSPQGESPSLDIRPPIRRL